MGRIVVSTNVSLDGVSQDPTGEEGLPFGGWFSRMSAADREAWDAVEYEESLSVDAMMLGGRTYAWFAPKWVGRAGAWGERLQSLPKYVVRSTPGRTDWGPTTVLDGDVVDEVTKLKQNIAGTIVVYASCQLVHTLLEHDLVDEVRLIVFPHILGAGAGPLGPSTTSRDLRLIEAAPVGTGLFRVAYEVVHAE